MDADEILRQMTIPNPCSMDWANMRGDERTRHCDSCGKQVHNLTAMESSEAAALLGARDGEICGRVFQHADGTLSITSPQALPQAPPRRWQFQIRTLMAVIASFAAALGIARLLSVDELPIPTNAPAAGEFSTPRKTAVPLDGMMVSGCIRPIAGKP